MASSTQELRLDAEEVRQLLSSACRQRIKGILTLELRKIETEITRKDEENKKQEADGSEQPTTQQSKPVSTKPRLPTIDIKTYAWDQSEKFMKIYATVPEVETVPKEQVTCSFRDRSFNMRCEAVKNKNYTCEVTNLMECIVPEESLFKIKSNTVLIMLKKKESGKTWAYVTQTEKKTKDKPSKPSVDKAADPNDSLMTMMKQMYDDGDDEMKRTIAKAWTESRGKQGQGDMAL